MGEKSAEFFLKEISNLVISDFKILKKNKIKGITLKILKDMIHNDQDFLKDISNEELEKKFNEYDIMKKGYLDKISYSGILSEFMIAKAALNNLNKFFDAGKNSSVSKSQNEINENKDNDEELDNNDCSVSYYRDRKGKENKDKNKENLEKNTKKNIISNANA